MESVSSMKMLMAGLLISSLVAYVIFIVRDIKKVKEWCNAQNLYSVPCSVDVTLSEKGKQSVFLEHPKAVKYSSTRVNSCNTRLASGLCCKLIEKETGKHIELEENIALNSLRYGNFKAYSVFDFWIDNPGIYSFKAWYKGKNSDEDIRLSIGRYPGNDLLFLATIVQILILAGLIYLAKTFD